MPVVDALSLAQESSPAITAAGDEAGVLGRALKRYEPRLILPSTNVWRASVALVLRWTRHVSDAPDEPVRSFLQRHAGALELLFIQRAKRPGDPWSGHIAFPGGRREDADEGDLGTAVRETKEELGLDLSDSNQFRLLGRLDDEAIPVSKRGRQGGVLSPFVFLQKPPDPEVDVSYEEDAEAPGMSLDASEVAACLWVPVKYLLAGSGAKTDHVFAIRAKQLGVIGCLTPPFLLRSLGLLRVRHMAVDVVAACTEIVYAEGGDSPMADAVEKDDPNPVLWGMSFRAASDLVQVIGGRPHAANQPVFVFDNRILATLHRSIHRVTSVLLQRLAFPLRLMKRRRRRVGD